jgi:hypothetical protein
MNCNFNKILMDNNWSYWGSECQEIGHKNNTWFPSHYLPKSLKLCVKELAWMDDAKIIHYNKNSVATHKVTVKEAKRLLKLYEL